jgi:hypothetical protein
MAVPAGKCTVFLAALQYRDAFARVESECRVKGVLDVFKLV